MRFCGFPVVIHRETCHRFWPGAPKYAWPRCLPSLVSCRASLPSNQVASGVEILQRRDAGNVPATENTCVHRPFRVQIRHLFVDSPTFGRVSSVENVPQHIKSSATSPCSLTRTARRQVMWDGLQRVCCCVHWRDGSTLSFPLMRIENERMSFWRWAF